MTNRRLAELAAAAGRADAAAKAAERAREARDAAMVRAHAEGASYRELEAATGLTRTGVYKALASGSGGSVSRSTPVAK